jgi:hypothetical protein
MDHKSRRTIHLATDLTPPNTLDYGLWKAYVGHTRVDCDSISFEPRISIIYSAHILQPSTERPRSSRACVLSPSSQTNMRSRIATCIAQRLNPTMSHQIVFAVAQKAQHAQVAHRRFCEISSRSLSKPKLCIRNIYKNTPP